MLQCLAPVKVSVTDVLGRGPLERKFRRKRQVTALLTQDLGSAPAWPLLAQALALWERRRARLDPWHGKLLYRREWLPTPVFLPGELHEQRSLAGYSPWGLKETDTTE